MLCLFVQRRSHSAIEPVSNSRPTYATDSEWRVAPGARLPPTTDPLGVSRTSVRGGLQALVAKGVVVTRHGAGKFVADGPPVLDSEPLSMLAALHGFTRAEMFEARRTLEVGVAGLAAERATGDDLAAMSEGGGGLPASVSHRPDSLLPAPPPPPARPRPPDQHPPSSLLWLLCAPTNRQNTPTDRRLAIHDPSRRCIGRSTRQSGITIGRARRSSCSSTSRVRNASRNRNSPRNSRRQTPQPRADVPRASLEA